MTCVPVTEGVLPVADHCVASSSSIRPPRLLPSPLALAPLALDAQLVGMSATTLVVWFAVKVRLNRKAP